MRVILRFIFYHSSIFLNIENELLPLIVIIFYKQNLCNTAACPPIKELMDQEKEQAMV